MNESRPDNTTEFEEEEIVDDEQDARERYEEITR